MPFKFFHGFDAITDAKGDILNYLREHMLEEKNELDLRSNLYLLKEIWDMTYV